MHSRGRCQVARGQGGVRRPSQYPLVCQITGLPSYATGYLHGGWRDRRKRRERRPTGDIGAVDLPAEEPGALRRGAALVGADHHHHQAFRRLAQQLFRLERRKVSRAVPHRYGGLLRSAVGAADTAGGSRRAGGAGGAVGGAAARGTAAAVAGCRRRCHRRGAGGGRGWQRLRQAVRQFGRQMLAGALRTAVQNPYCANCCGRWRCGRCCSRLPQARREGAREVLQVRGGGCQGGAPMGALTSGRRSTVPWVIRCGEGEEQTFPRLRSRLRIASRTADCQAPGPLDAIQLRKRQ